MHKGLGEPTSRRNPTGRKHGGRPAATHLHRSGRSVRRKGHLYQDQREIVLQRPRIQDPVVDTIEEALEVPQKSCARHPLPCPRFALRRLLVDAIDCTELLPASKVRPAILKFPFLDFGESGLRVNTWERTENPNRSETSLGFRDQRY